jgi:hypothetical protein
MGSCESKEEEIIPRISELLEEFIEKHGKEDISENIKMSTLVMLFTSYMKMYYPDECSQITISIIKDSIEELCWKRGYERSQVENMQDYMIIGLSIEEFEMLNELP